MEKTEYKFAFFDAQYFLTRNWMMLKDKEGFNEQSLFKSFLQTIVKLVREEIKVEQVILLWDRYPYHTHTFLPDYKGDREYRGEADITDDMSEEEKQELIKKTRQFQIRQKVKYDYLIKEGSSYGLPSVILKGFESDNLAYLVSKSKLVQDEEKKSVLISCDSDWAYFVNEKVDFYRVTKKRELKTIEDLKEECGELDPYYYKSLVDALYGSHNFLKDNRNRNIILDSINQVDDYFREGNFSFTDDKDLFIRQFSSFKVEEYPDVEVAMGLIEKVLDEVNYMDSSQFFSYCLSKFININVFFYDSFLESIGKK